MKAMVKKGFLQACINHGCLSIERISEILTPLCEAYDDPAPEDLNEIKNFVTEINKQLSEFNQVLTFVKHPLLNEEFLVFGLTFETSACKLQPHYTEGDRYYFGKLLETLVNQEEYGIPWVAVYSVMDSVAATQRPKQQMSKNRIQDLVQRWVDQGYYLEKDEMLYFGPRMLVEYGSHLKMHFPELVKDCPLCGILVLWDVKCSECETRIHRDCIRKYLRKNSNCPKCKGVWNTRLSLSQ